MNNLKSKTCCFTGHRKLTINNKLKNRIKTEIIDLIKRGVIYFGAGGALGFDTFAEQTILELKADYPQIKLILVLPCENQTKGWSKTDILEYERIKQKADKVVYISKEYTKECMIQRNRHLVDNSCYCICYFNGKAGGTAFTVNYAEKQGLHIINCI